MVMFSASIWMPSWDVGWELLVPRVLDHSGLGNESLGEPKWQVRGDFLVEAFYHPRQNTVLADVFYQDQGAGDEIRK